MCFVGEHISFVNMCTINAKHTLGSQRILVLSAIQIMAALYAVICANVNSVALAAALTNPSNGLFYDKTMKQAVYLEQACHTHKDVLCGILGVSSEPTRVELQTALQRFNALHQGKLFSNEDEDDHSCRHQAHGLKMMLGYILRRRSNLKDGTRTHPAIMDLIHKAGEAIRQFGRPSTTSPSPSPPSSRCQKTTSSGSSSTTSVFEFSFTETTVQSDNFVQEDLEVISSTEEIATEEDGDQDLLEVEPNGQSVEGFKQYTDWSSNKMVRLYLSGAVEVGEMFVKPNQAFKWARFANGDEVATCLFH
jgi:hypothetical protein